MSLNIIDSKTIDFFNQFAQQLWVFDRVVVFIANNCMLKGGMLIALLWYAWFYRHQQPDRLRSKIISGIFASLVALVIARALAVSLPFRLRPLHIETLDFTLPYGLNPELIEGWWASSSLPSDHAVLFFALSSCLFLVSKKLGLIAFVYTSIFIALPRIYLGLHYATDIFAGALVGILVVWLVDRSRLCQRMALFLYRNGQKQPHWFYCIMFIVSYQIADMFESSRAMVSLLLELIDVTWSN